MISFSETIQILNRYIGLIALDKDTFLHLNHMSGEHSVNVIITDKKDNTNFSAIDGINVVIIFNDSVEESTKIAPNFQVVQFDISHLTEQDVCYIAQSIQKIRVNGGFVKPF